MHALTDASEHALLTPNGLGCCRRSLVPFRANHWKKGRCRVVIRPDICDAGLGVIGHFKLRPSASHLGRKTSRWWLVTRQIVPFSNPEFGWSLEPCDVYLYSQRSHSVGTTDPQQQCSQIKSTLTSRIVLTKSRGNGNLDCLMICEGWAKNKTKKNPDDDNLIVRLIHSVK